MRSVLLTFAHPLFIYYIPILEDHNAVQILTGLFYCCKIFFSSFCHLGRCFTTWKRLGEGIYVYEIYSSFPDYLLDLRIFQKVCNSLTVNGHILVAYVHYGRHLRIVVCRMIHEHISLAFLKLVQHLDEACNLFFSSSFRTIIAYIFKVILLECIETVHGREIIFFGQFLYEGIDFRTVTCRHHMAGDVCDLRDVFQSKLDLCAELLLDFLYVKLRCVFHYGLSRICRIRSHHREEIAVLIHHTRAVCERSPFDIFPLAGNCQVHAHVEAWIFLKHLHGLREPGSHGKHLDRSGYAVLIGVDAGCIYGMQCSHIIDSDDKFLSLYAEI